MRPGGEVAGRADQLGRWNLADNGPARGQVLGVELALDGSECLAHSVEGDIARNEATSEILYLVDDRTVGGEAGHDTSGQSSSRPAGLQESHRREPANVSHSGMTPPRSARDTFREPTSEVFPELTPDQKQRLERNIAALQVIAATAPAGSFPRLVRRKVL